MAEQELSQELEPEILEQEQETDLLDEPETESASDDGPTEEEKATARRMGWADKDKYRGHPAKWVDAREFIRRGENELPILRERLRHQDEQLRRQDETIREMKDTFTEFREYHTETVNKQYQKAMRELQQQSRAAVETGDVEAYDRTQKAMEELQEDFRLPQAKTERKDDAPANQEPPPEHPYYREWVTKNDWYTKDKDAHAYANDVGVFLAKTRPELVGKADFMDAVADEVRKRFPDKFENPQRNAPPAVEGGGTAARGKAKTYANLPASAKAACDRYIKQGLIKSRDDYVANYEWE